MFLTCKAIFISAHYMVPKLLRIWKQLLFLFLTNLRKKELDLLVILFFYVWFLSLVLVGATSASSPCEGSKEYLLHFWSLCLSGMGLLLQKWESQAGRNSLTAVYIVYSRAVAVQETLENRTSRSPRRWHVSPLRWHLKH